LNKLCGFFWYQGESDIQANNPTYNLSFEQFLTDLKIDIYGNQFNNNLPIIVTEIAAEYNNVVNNVFLKKYVNDYFISIANDTTRPNIKIIRTNDLNSLVDKIHLTKISQRIAGNRAYDAFITASLQLNRKATRNEGIVINENKNIMLLRNTVVDADLDVEGNFSCGELNVVGDLDLSGTLNADIINTNIVNVDFVNFNNPPPTGFTNIPLSQFIQKEFSLNITGGVTATQIITVTFIKLGKMVFMQSNGVTFITGGTQSNVEITAGQIPSFLNPISGLYIVVSTAITTSGTTSAKFLYWRFQPSGQILITDDTNDPVTSEDFITANSTVRIRPFNFCYMVVA
jgi:hypothetical protein